MFGMWISDVDFPDELIRAQRGGRLAVFAGSGVSRPEPSSYPDFAGLVEVVAKGTVLELEKDKKPEDRFLGRLASSGVLVHKKVKEILSKPEAKPCSLHRDLLRLFVDESKGREGSKVRLVTTNFDVLFEQAAKELFPGAQPEVFHASALPTGKSFYGIAHIHGSVEKSAERLVLTDGDFGKAYLTEGWATRFLLNVFQESTVLFVGYSHSDTVMQYLARGMPAADAASPHRFALVKDGESGVDWELLGVTPVVFPDGGPPNAYSALERVLDGWANRCGMTVLDHAQEIERLVQQPFDLLSKGDLNYLSVECRKLPGVNFFIQHAKELHWLDWAANDGLLNGIFRVNQASTAVDQRFASWFADKFVCKEPDEAMVAMRDHGGEIAEVLWSHIGFAFHRGAASQRGLQLWIPELIRFAPRGSRYDLLEYALRARELPQDEDLVKQLFWHLTRPEVNARPSPEWNERFELKTVGSSYWLNHAWHALVEPHLDSVGEWLLILANCHIEQAYLLKHTYEKNAETRTDDQDFDLVGFDPIEVVQSADHDPKVKILAVIARRSLQWSIANKPLCSSYFIEKWRSSKYSLLRRLALFGIADSPGWEPDRAVRMLLEQDLLYPRSEKAEVFRVLKRKYANASPSIRQEILQRTLAGANWLDERSTSYAIFNLLSWLSEAAPECAETSRQLGEFASKHPNYTRREHPDRDVQIGSVGFHAPKSPLTIEQITAMNEKAFLELWTRTLEFSFDGPDREGIEATLYGAMKSDPDWGVRFAVSLNAEAAVEDRIWRTIVNGWTRADLSDANWKAVLELLRERPTLYETTTRELAELLHVGCSKEACFIPEALFGSALETSVELWRVCKELPARLGGSQDWLQVAINEPAGVVVQFWFDALLRVRRAAGESWNGIPVEYKALLDSVVHGETYSDEIGRVIVASRLRFFYALDKPWASQIITPLLSFSGDDKKALQAWHGFLPWSGWAEEMLPGLMPCFEGAFSKVHSEFGEQRESFCGYIAGIACTSSYGTTERDWLGKFLRSVTGEERAMWAYGVADSLKVMTPEAVQQAWSSWIRNYWNRRLDGIPVPLTGTEAGQMLDWALHLGAAFSEAVEMLCRGEKPETQHNFVYEELANAELRHEFPKAASQFMLLLLKIEGHSYFDFNAVDGFVREMKTAAGTRAALVEICEQLALLGYSNAGELRKFVQG